MDIRKFHLSTKQYFIKGKPFLGVRDVITDTNTHCRALDKCYYLEGINKLGQYWVTCINLRGDHIKKYNSLSEKLKYFSFFTDISYYPRMWWVFISSSKLERFIFRSLNVYIWNYQRTYLKKKLQNE